MPVNIADDQAVDPHNERIINFTALPGIGVMPQNYTAVTIIDDDYANLKIPNAFTPNGDGINDTWNIPNLAYDTQCKVKIYDRYGTLVYTSTGYGISWDGRNNGQNVPAGTYYYAINSHGRTFSGTVSVIR